MGRAARTWQLRRCMNRWSAAMPQPKDLSRSLVALDQNSTIIAVVELSQSSWLVGAPFVAWLIEAASWRWSFIITGAIGDLVQRGTLCRCRTGQAGR